MPRLLVASQDGNLYIYNLDPAEGGECTLLKQHRWHARWLQQKANDAWFKAIARSLVSVGSSTLVTKGKIAPFWWTWQRQSSWKRWTGLETILYPCRLDGRQDSPSSLTDASSGSADKPLTHAAAGATSSPLAYGSAGTGRGAPSAAENTGSNTPPQSSTPGKPQHQRGETYAKALRTNDAVFDPEDIIQEELTYYSCHGGTVRRLGNARSCDLVRFIWLFFVFLHPFSCILHVQFNFQCNRHSPPWFIHWQNWNLLFGWWRFDLSFMRHLSCVEHHVSAHCLSVNIFTFQSCAHSFEDPL